ncbi:hypothetical protein [Scytonema sp. NUACC26]|uniref:hypothetical protein n=1 Tax=Scytonema sp. NUACC26 TaxID=3140176 RepID=UPI0034DC9928
MVNYDTTSYESISIENSSFERSETVITPNTRYTLVVDVGNTGGTSTADGSDFTVFPNYALVLAAGDTVLDYTINPVAIPEGELRTVTLSYATLPINSFGENLEVRLLNLNSDSGSEVNFDRVQLIASPVGNTNLLAIANSDFDAIALNDDTYTNRPPSGWNVYDPNGLLLNSDTDSSVGTFNPPKTNFFNETTGQLFFGNTEGENTAYVYLTEQPGSGVVGLSQTLDAKLTANTRYTLLVDVGNPTGIDTAETGASFEGFPGYRIELLAGDTVVATDNNTLKIAEGSFATSTVDFIASQDNPLLGENLQLRLINLINGDGLEVDFDSVAIFTEEVKDSSSVFIDNPSFELPVLADRDFTLTPPPGWEIYNPNGFVLSDPASTASGIGVFNPGNDVFVNEATDGQNTAYIYLTEAPGSGVVGFSQTLDTVLAANTQYTLQVDVGNAAGSFDDIDLTGFPGYRVELLAGDTVLASEQNNIFIQDGTFETSTVTFTATSDNLYLGQNLGIRLVNILQGTGVEVDFDNVRLSAEAIPTNFCNFNSVA